MRVRRVISILVWVLCLPSLLGHALLGSGALAALVRGGEISQGGVWGVAFVYVALACGYFSWVAFFVMNVGWLRCRVVGRFWPVLGTLAALVGFAPLANSELWPVVLALPGIIFAGYLSLWHIGALHRNEHVS